MSTAIAKKSFAKVTEDHDLETRHLTPCAERFYHWLLRAVPAGNAQEVWLEEFSAFADYSLRHVRRAIEVLLNADLVEVVRQYSGKAFKLIAFHPGQKPTAPEETIAPSEIREGGAEQISLDEKIPTLTEKVQNGIEMSQKHPSTLHSSVSNDQSFIKTTDIPGINAPQEKLTREVVQLNELAAQIIATEPMNPRLRERIQAAEPRTVANAIELVQYRKQFGSSKIENMPGLLIEAIRSKWHLREVERQRLQQFLAGSAEVSAIAFSLSTPTSLPQGFKDWFSLAQTAKVVKASRAVGSGIEVLNSSDQWEPWEGLAAAFPIPKIKDLVRVLGFPIYD
jgi:hypothetical protein